VIKVKFLLRNSFDFSAGAGKSDVETFVRQLRFTTSNKVQKVSVCATTEGTSATTEITVNGNTVELKYFNGHYYGFVPEKNCPKKKRNLQKNTLSFGVKCVIIFTATFQRVFEGQTNTIFRRN